MRTNSNQLWFLLKVNSSILETLNSETNVSLQVSSKDVKEFARILLLGGQSIAREQAKLDAKADRLLTIDEAAKLLSVSKMALYRWDKSGYLKKIEIGGKRRYRLSDIEKRVGCKLNPESNVSK